MNGDHDAFLGKFKRFNLPCAKKNQNSLLSSCCKQVMYHFVMLHCRNICIDALSLNLRLAGGFRVNLKAVR